MEPIVTIREKCRKCYCCVRSCPVKAIKVDSHHAEIIYSRCIGCGKCLACPQKAKVVSDRKTAVEGLLASGKPVIAVLGCSYPSFFNSIEPGQLVAAIKRLGFSEVHEGAYGVELVAPRYARTVEDAGSPLISTHCPAIVDLIERHYPRMIPNLMSVVSPMAAMGRFLKTVWEGECNIVYLSSCIAAKFEIQSPETGNVIDHVLTYRELEELLKSRGISPSTLPPAPFDGIPPHLGRLFPIAGGSLNAFSILTNPLDTDIVRAEGEVNVMGIIRDMASGLITPRLADLRFCYGGCTGAPGRKSDLSEFSKRNLIIASFRKEPSYLTSPRYLGAMPAIDLERSFSDKHLPLTSPRGGEIRSILRATNKFAQKDELNCRACGYRTCREYAVAVSQGLADLEMCLPHTLQQLEEDRGRLIQKYELARRELDKEYADDFIVGKDRRTMEVLDLIKQVGPTPTTVLIRGESGTGKELTARAIHRHSLRNDKPLVTVNCTTLTDSLLESELFGHKKGSFTGAIADRKGLFEAADGGTIFLDEIGDITPKLQAELLRVLDTGEVRPVGGTAAKTVDVRLMAATNKNLDQGVREGWFREDLYYRLNVFTITMPPLRSRVDSIPLLAHHFLEKARKKLNKNIIALEERALKAMTLYQWPGNIREMQNIIERAAVLAQEQVIGLDNLPTVFSAILNGSTPQEMDTTVSFRAERQRHVLKVEKNLLERYLTETGGNVSRAASLANIPRRTFYRLMTKYGIHGRGSRSPVIVSE